MHKKNADKNDYEYTLLFNCPEQKRCLAWRRFKQAVPWVVYETLSDGAIVATGDIIKTLQHATRLRKQIQRSCILCKKRKLNGR